MTFRAPNASPQPSPEDSLPQGRERLERLARVAARLLRAPMALVWLRDGEEDQPRDASGLLDLCARAASLKGGEAASELLVVPDARLHEGLARDEAVRGEGGVRFLAQAALRGTGGAELGTLCVLDVRPRAHEEFDAADWEALASLASGVASLVEAEREDARRREDETEQALRRAHDEMEARVQERTRELAQANAVLRAEVLERQAAQARQRGLAQGLEAVLRAADELLGCADIDSLTQRAVELARSHLGLERCSIYLLDLQPESGQPERGQPREQEGEQSSAEVGIEPLGRRLSRWRGSFGTDMAGHTTDERAWRGVMGWLGWSGDPLEGTGQERGRKYLPGSQDVPEAASQPEPESRWKVREKPPEPGSDESAPELDGREMWEAVTPIASGRGVIGILFNDAAISRGALDEARQELATVFCSLLGSLVDRLRVVEELRASEERFRFLADAVPDFVWTCDAQGRNDFVNRRFCAFTGLSRERLMGEGWTGILHESDEERTQQAWQRSVATGQPYEIEYRFRDRRSGGYRWFLGRAEPQRDESGRIIKWFGTCTDIHDRKTAEETVRQALDALRGAHGTLQQSNARLEDRVRERTEELAQANSELGRANALLRTQVRERERAEAALERHASELERSNRELQQFASIASHDLQEPLRTMASYIQLVEKRYGDKLDDRGRVYIGHAVEGAQRMQRLINDLLSYARVGSQGRAFEPVDCNAVLGQVEHALRASVKEGGAQITHHDLPTLLADPVQIAQLFQNLIANALKYHGTAPPRVHISAQEWQDGAQKGWLFQVRDNGLGIAPEHHERVFEVFQRLHTRAEYSGTGIGLAICQKIVERHGGRIWVEADADGEEVGSTFCFLLAAGAD